MASGLMEDECTKKKKQMKSRSPLQNLDPFHKRNSSNLLFNSCSSTSRFYLDKTPKVLPKSVDKSKPQSRSHQNKASRKPNSQKCENGRISKISTVGSKKGLQEFQSKTKNFRENRSGKQDPELLEASTSSNLIYSDNHTPHGSVDSLSFGKLGHPIYGDSKTPPIEASLSPEINCNSHSKTVVMKSEATPVCYGAGHLISGVKDRRKCKRRGSLRGPEKVDLFRINDPIPVLAEASVRWHLSPCKEGQETDKLNVFDDLDKSSFSGSDSVVMSPRKVSDMEGIFELNVVRLGFDCAEFDKSSDLDLGLCLGDDVEKNVGSVCSWVSDSTLGNESLSEMRVSWRDEFDYLLDGDVKSVEKDLVMRNDVSPVVLDYEPCVSAKGKKDKSISCRTAESISTDGGGLAASDDSGWTYFQEDAFK